MRTPTSLAIPALRHRIACNYAAQAANVDSERLIDMLMESVDADKTYEGVMHLGVSTDSQDRDGEVTEERDASGVTQEQLEAEIAKYRGDIQQIPPMVSAIKKDGVPLYKMSRKGKTIEREPRLIHLYEFKLKDYEPPKASFVLRCTKGTYVRTLASDIGDGLGCGAHLSDLRRTESGLLSVKDAMKLDDLLTVPREELGGYVMTVSRYRALGQEDG